MLRRHPTEVHDDEAAFGVALQEVESPDAGRTGRPLALAAPGKKNPRRAMDPGAEGERHRHKIGLRQSR